MKVFGCRQVREAIVYAADGGQALHVHTLHRAVAGAPACFRRSRQAAHLFDRDADRLRRTVRRLGVRVILVEREGTDRQHVDLCGRPLERALAECGGEWWS